MGRGKRALAVITIASFGVAGCATNSEGWGTKQTVGSVIGALGGALLGSQIGGGTGRTIAIIAGALAGGALGNWIGSNLDEKDRQALAASTQQALETGKPVAWQSDHSGASATIKPVSSKTVTHEGSIKRSAKIATVSKLDVINQPYQAKSSTNLRAGPDTSAAKVGGFSAGQSFTALGRTDNNWIAVGRKGVTVGYVYGPLVGPVAAKTDEATDLDSISVAQAQGQGFDLDAIEPADPVVDQVAVQTTCRTVTYDVRTAKGSESKTVDACQAPDGAWQLG